MHVRAAMRDVACTAVLEYSSTCGGRRDRLAIHAARTNALARAGVHWVPLGIDPASLVVAKSFSGIPCGRACGRAGLSFSLVFSVFSVPQLAVGIASL